MAGRWGGMQGMQVAAEPLSAPPYATECAMTLIGRETRASSAPTTCSQLSRPSSWRRRRIRKRRRKRRMTSLKERSIWQRRTSPGEPLVLPSLRLCTLRAGCWVLCLVSSFKVGHCEHWILVTCFSRYCYGFEIMLNSASFFKGNPRKNMSICIPDICDFFYTVKFFGEKNLHRKTPIFRVKSVKNAIFLR